MTDHWTLPALKQHLERLIDDERTLTNAQVTDQKEAVAAALAAQEKATAAALDAAQRATVKAETAAERRFEAQNEFRGQLSDQAATFLPRREYDQAHIALVDKVDALDKRITEQLTVINSRLDLTQGRGSGTASTVAYVIAAVGVVATIISVVIGANVLTG